MKNIAIFLLIGISLTLGCTAGDTKDEAVSGDTSTVSIDTATASPSPPKPMTILEAGSEVVEIIKEKDMPQLAQWVHPEKGVLFSPYGFINRDNSKVFTKQQVAALADDPNKYTWGYQDGSGFPIELTFNDYYAKYIYNKDFVNADKVASDSFIGKGNTKNNLLKEFPGAHFVEFHFPGSKEYDQMDWNSLRLVFEKETDQWHLVAVVHDQWTI